MKKYLVSGFIIYAGVAITLAGCSSKNVEDSNKEIINQLETDIISATESVTVEVEQEKPKNDDNLEEERVEVDIPVEQPESKPDVPNANRSSYTYNEIKFFDGLNTGSFTLQASIVDGDKENAVMSIDIRGDRRTDIVKLDLVLPTNSLQSYIDVGNAVVYTNSNGSGWAGAVNDSGIDEIDSLTVSNLFGTDWTFDRTDEYFAYFKKTGNTCDVLTLLEDLSVGYSLVSGEMKINRETLRMVDMTQTGVVSKFDSETGETIETTYKVKASIQDINSLGTIMLPSEISDNIIVDTTKSNITIYD